MLLRWKAGSARANSQTAYVFYSSSLIASEQLFVCAKGRKDTRVTNMIVWLFGGFRYYHSIEYTKLDWLKALNYRSFKTQTSSLPTTNVLVFNTKCVDSMQSALALNRFKCVRQEKKLHPGELLPLRGYKISRTTSFEQHVSGAFLIKHP